MEKCPNCGHDWHGLYCAHVNESYVLMLQPDRLSQQCGCPPQFRD